MGEVFLGHDVLLDRKVAIKFLRPHPDDDLDQRELSLAEARAAAQLQGPNVVAVYRVGEVDGLAYIVSEYVAGRNLDLLPRPLPWQRALELGLGLSKGLAAAHERGVLHRDIKLSNAILAEDGTVKLLDFGLAKLMGVPDAASGLSLKQSAPGSTSAATTDEYPPLPLKQATAPDDAKKAAESGEAQKRVAVPLSSKGAGVVSVREHALLGPPGLGRPGGEGRGPSGIRGTPQYMAPEVLLGVQATMASDVYSMGVLLFELCVGVAPHADLTVASLLDTATRREAPSLRQFVPTVDPRFAEVIDRCLRLDPAERYRSARELHDALDQVRQQLLAFRPVSGNPYRGLQPYQSEHRALLAGRRTELTSLQSRLRSESCIVVAGVSGVGKTSLLQAGLLALTAEEGLGDGLRWRTITLTPSSWPLQALAAAIMKGLGGSEQLSEPELLRLLRDQPERLGHTLSELLGPGESLLLVVDQLEELLGATIQQEAQQFALAVCSLIEGSKRLRLLLAVRSDQWSLLSQTGWFTAVGLGSFHTLGPMSHERLRDMVLGSALASGVTFDPESLIDELVAQVVQEDGLLSLLQLVLAELWEARSGDRITVETLRTVGGALGPIARHAELTISMMTPEQRRVARRLLLRLHADSGKPLPKDMAELVDGEEVTRRTLQRLVQARLVQPVPTAQGPICHIAHPMLSACWPTLQRWLAEYQPLLEKQRQITRTTRSWVQNGHADPLLLSSRQLHAVQSIDPEALTTQEREFLRASQRAVRRRRYALGSLPILGLLLLGIPVVGHGTCGRSPPRPTLMLPAEVRDLVSTAQAQHLAVDRAWEAALLLHVGGQPAAAASQLAGADQLSLLAQRSYFRAAHATEAGLRQHPKDAALQQLLADILTSHAVLAESGQEEVVLEDLLLRLDLYDPSGERRRSLHAPGRLMIEVEPAGAQLQAIRYIKRDDQSFEAREEKNLGRVSAAMVQLELPPGLYLLRFSWPEPDGVTRSVADLVRAVLVHPSRPYPVRVQQTARRTPASP